MRWLALLSAGCSSILGITDPHGAGPAPDDGKAMDGKDVDGSIPMGCARTPTFIAKTPLSAPPGAIAFAAGQFDTNGTPDLVMIGTSSTNLTIIHDVVGAHTVQTLALPAAASGGREIHVLDVDGDGVDDLIFVTQGADNTAYVQLQDKTQPGNFQAAVQIGGVGPMFHRLAVGDLDHDGRPDVAILVGTLAHVYYQDPSTPGTFQPAVNVPISTSAQPFDSIALGDIDHDGRVDLITDGGGKVTFVSQLPMPHQFGSPQSIGPSGVNDVAVGDLDGDGFDDIVASATQAIPMFQGPAGVFTSENPLGSVNLGAFPEIFDLNGDGRADVFTGTSFLQCAPPAAPRMFDALHDAVTGYADIDGDQHLDQITLDGPNATVTIGLQQ